MHINASQIKELVLRPAESLNVEVKRWIDPTEPDGIAKIARAALAIRNRNGGYLIVGFDDKTLQPDIEHQPEDVRSVFHVDRIQGIVSRFSSDLFEVGVAFGERDGHEYPVIVIPEGVRTLVAAKADLIDGGKRLVHHGGVYFRSLSSNGTPSTTLARLEDWLTELSLDTPASALAPFVAQATQDLFALFNGYIMPSEVVEEWVRRLVERRLGAL
jgi:hypothetical protein